MGLSIGNNTIGSLYLGSTKIGEAYLGSTKVYESIDPLNPLGLPPFTIRVRWGEWGSPSQGDSQTLVDPTNHIYDVTYNTTDWSHFFEFASGLIEILGANSTGVTTLESAFALSQVETSAVFDTRSVTNMSSVLYQCMNLTALPMWDTGNVTNADNAFSNDTDVAANVLEMYQQLSTQTVPPVSHTGTFMNCGINTPGGAAILNQIPSSWGGQGA